MRDPRRDQPWFPDLCRLPRLAALLAVLAWRCKPGAAPLSLKKPAANPVGVARTEGA